MAPKTYDLAFHAHMPCALGVGTFRFARPALYRHEPGQFFSLTLQTREGEQSKHFTHCEAPGDPWIQLTTRLTGSAFKDALLALRPHDTVRITGPRGHLTVPEGAGKVAFLAGGVGITPAHSIIRDAVLRGTGLRVLLFFGNQDQTCIPFGEEFTAYAEEHAEIEVIDVLAAPHPGWDGETGFITADVVRRHCDPLDGWHWVVAGPPAMIDAMKRVLAELAIPGERISLESFSGYE